jgi:hypothetical protein
VCVVESLGVLIKTLNDVEAIIDIIVVFISLERMLG